MTLVDKLRNTQWDWLAAGVGCVAVVAGVSELMEVLNPYNYHEPLRSVTGTLDYYLMQSAEYGYDVLKYVAGAGVGLGILTGKYSKDNPAFGNNRAPLRNSE
tara:strand:+ start:11614 stop:11919 length:306 start_codon:yes stop_codon:yes gene_type:complete